MWLTHPSPVWRRPRVLLTAMLLLLLAMLAPMLAPSSQGPSAHAEPAPSFCQEAEPVGWNDVPADSLFADDIACITDHEITKGAGDGSFDPRGSVTRQQMALFIARFLETLTEEALEDDAALDFSDLDRVIDEARTAIDKLTTVGIVHGVTSSEYRPRQAVTRAQMASFVSRTLDGLGVDSDDSGPRFADVGRTGAHADAIRHLAALGVVEGYGDGEFRPGREVSREQMARFLTGAADAALASNGDTPLSFEALPQPEPEPRDGGSPDGSGIAGTELTTSNTGFRAAGLSASDLRSSGSITTSSHGQVIDRMDVSGQIRVRHRDVTIRNSRVRHSGGYGISVESGDVGTVTIENVEVDGRGVADGIGIYVTAPVHVTRAHIHGQRVGMQVSSNSTVQESYIHDQAVASGTHNTAMSSHGATGLVIRNNRLESSTSASLSLYPRLAPIRDAQVTGNLFEGNGRGIGLYAGYTSNHPYRDQNRDIRIEGNRWTGSFQHGTHLAWNPNQPGNVWRDNAWLDGRPVG